MHYNLKVALDFYVKKSPNCTCGINERSAYMCRFHEEYLQFLYVAGFSGIFNITLKLVCMAQQHRYVAAISKKVLKDYDLRPL